MSNDSSASGDEASASTDGNKSDRSQLRRQASSARPPAAVAATHSKNSEQLTLVKKKRNLPGNPDPDSEVIALSPKTLLATNRFICEICNKGFQRDQNLQLHRRGHNLPWKLRQRTSKEIKRRVYICPETTCVHHDPARALGDLTGIKKHFCRKHWEKKWKCDKCSKRYAVQSDYKAHMKICGTREYQCHCGTSFSRRDSFITHRAFCDALVEENERVSAHRQGGTQHPGDIENTLNTGSFEGPLSNIGANSSSRGATSPLSGDGADPLTSSALLKPGASDNTWSMALSEGAIASLASMWTQGSTEASSGLIASNTGPRLSLYLGTGPGPGPGPPGARPMMEGSQMQSSSSLLTSSDSDHPLQMQPPKGMRGGMEVTGMGGSADFGATHAPKLPSELMPLPSSNGGILANIFACGGGFPDLQGPSPERSLGVSHSGVAGLAGLMNQGTSAAGLQLSSAGMFTGRNSATGIGGGRISSISQHQSSRAQMSATALLQKAAQMGVTGSSPSLLRGCGLEGGDLGYSTFGGTLQDSQQNQGRLVLNSLLSGSFPPYLTMMRRLEGIQQQTQGLEHPDGPSFSLQGRSNENIGAQDFVNSVSGRTDLFGGGLNHPPSLFGPSGNHSGAETPSINLLNHCESRNSGQNSLLNMLQGFSQSQAAGSHMGQRSEDGGDRPTLDFLGVQGRNRMGVAGDVGCILSHRDLASITLLGTGPETASSNNQRKKIRMVGGGQSPGKS